jgi:LacI family transcriptional regulator
MPPTIKEVAERAGVSVSTVSRVLNDYPFVSAGARRRVIDAMGELEYRPDVAARSMRTGSSNTVGFVVADISNPLFAAIAKGVDSVLVPHGYSLVLANSENDPDHEAALLRALRQRRLDGLIAAVADERAPGLAGRLEEFATVLFDRDVAGSSADAVWSDHDSGIGEALERLSGLGHRRVALIAGSEGQLGSRARIVAFRRHARRLGLSVAGGLVRSSEPERESGQRAARELLAAPDPPTALMIAHNLLTVGVLEALSDLGVRLPDDLSVVACDDVDVTRLFSPPIDVIERDLLELGETSARLLLERLADRDGPPRRVVLPTRLLVRESTAAPAALVALRTA